MSLALSFLIATSLSFVIAFYAPEGTSGGILKLSVLPSVSASVRYKSCLSDNLKSTEANLMKLHREIKHNQKVHRVQELSPYAQGQGHNLVKGQIMP